MVTLLRVQNRSHFSEKWLLVPPCKRVTILLLNTETVFPAYSGVFFSILYNHGKLHSGLHDPLTLYVQLLHGGSNDRSLRQCCT